MALGEDLTVQAVQHGKLAAGDPRPTHAQRGGCMMADLSIEFAGISRSTLLAGLTPPTDKAY